MEPAVVVHDLARLLLCLVVPAEEDRPPHADLQHHTIMTQQSRINWYSAHD